MSFPVILSLHQISFLEICEVESASLFLAPHSASKPHPSPSCRLRTQTPARRRLGAESGEFPSRSLDFASRVVLAGSALEQKGRREFRTKWPREKLPRGLPPIWMRWTSTRPRSSVLRIWKNRSCGCFYWARARWLCWPRLRRREGERVPDLTPIFQPPQTKTQRGQGQEMAADAGSQIHKTQARPRRGAKGGDAARARP